MGEWLQEPRNGDERPLSTQASGSLQGSRTYACLEGLYGRKIKNYFSACLAIWTRGLQRGSCRFEFRVVWIMVTNCAVDETIFEHRQSVAHNNVSHAERSLSRHVGALRSRCIFTWISRT